jgi:hypothetical protein
MTVNLEYYLQYKQNDDVPFWRGFLPLKPRRPQPRTPGNSKFLCPVINNYLCNENDFSRGLVPQPSNNSDKKFLQKDGQFKGTD